MIPFKVRRKDTGEITEVIGRQSNNKCIILDSSGWGLTSHDSKEHHIDEKYIGMKCWYMPNRSLEKIN